MPTADVISSAIQFLMILNQCLPTIQLRIITTSNTPVMSISPIVSNTHSAIIAIKNKNPMGILLSINLVYEFLTNKLLEASDR